MVRTELLSYTCTMARTYDRWSETHSPTSLDWNGLRGYVVLRVWTEDGPRTMHYPNPRTNVLSPLGTVPTGLLRGMFREEYRQTLTRIHILSRVDVHSSRVRNYRMMRSAGMSALEAWSSLDEDGTIRDDSEWWPENREED